MASYKELMDQAKQLMQQAEELRKSELKEVVANIRKQMEEYGLTVEDLGFGKTASTKPSGSSKAQKEAKYANPANPNETYGGGRGVKPKWVLDYLAVEGHKIEDLLIKK